YGEWTCAPCNYFSTNILHSEAKFGTEPWWWYFQGTAVALLPPLSLAFLCFFGLGVWKQPYHVLSWCLAPFVLVHTAVEHKEMRFLFPMIFPFLFLTVTGWAYFLEKYGMKKWMPKVFVAFVWINAIILALWVFMPAKEMAAFSRFLWHWEAKHPESSVYFVKDKPRKNFPLNMPFYENPTQTQSSWYTDPMYPNDTTALNSGDLMFFTEVHTIVPKAPPGFQLKRRYVYYPEWLLLNNTNNWQSRTRIWAVYELIHSPLHTNDSQ
ncbi:MAG: hypothetical protein ACKVT2_22360, partial [Saprospiraceae bacterium]